MAKKRKEQTQAEKVLNYLTSRGAITSASAISVLGITRLAAVVHAINEQAGVERISSRPLKGFRATVAEYFFNPAYAA